MKLAHRGATFLRFCGMNTLTGARGRPRCEGGSNFFGGEGRGGSPAALEDGIGVGKRVVSDGGEGGLRVLAGELSFLLSRSLCKDAAEGFDELLVSGGGEMGAGREVRVVEVVVVLGSGGQKCESRDGFGGGADAGAAEGRVVGLFMNMGRRSRSSRAGSEKSGSLSKSSSSSSSSSSSDSR